MRVRRRKTEVVIETHELLLIHPSAPIWCPECVEESRMLSPDAVASICKVSTRNIYCWVEAQKIHFRETARGTVLVCLNSCLLGATKAASGQPGDVSKCLEGNAR